MLYTLFVLWAFAVAVPATVLAVVVALQGVANVVRRLSSGSRSATQGAAAEA